MQYSVPTPKTVHKAISTTRDANTQTACHDNHSPITDPTNENLNTIQDELVTHVINHLDSLTHITPAPATIVNTQSQFNQHTYNADIYFPNINPNINDETLTPLTHMDETPKTNSMSLQDINSIIHIASQNLQQTPFTNTDLDAYLDKHYSINMILNPDVKMVRKDREQMDGGANTCITNNKNILRNFRNIQHTPVSGIGQTGPACFITGVGTMDLQTEEGDWLPIKVYYAPTCAGTIISPNAIVDDHPDYTSWTQHSHMDTGMATLSIYNRMSLYRRKTIQLYKHNNLWYIKQPYITTINRAKVHFQQLTYKDLEPVPQIMNATRQAQHELWHQRLLHPGTSVMQNIGSCVDGIPLNIIKHQFHHCDICSEAKVKSKKNKTPEIHNTKHIGERFHMDFGFVSDKNKWNRIIRSHDGYNSYLLITDIKTRYSWIFLTKNKQPPIQTVSTLLDMHGSKGGHRTIRTDQGGELASCQAFRNMIMQKNYTLEITGADNSSQNGIAERPHQTLANMVRSALTNADLPSKYWSDAIIHAVFIKNRLPHAAFNFKTTPYTELTGTKPNLASLRIFGSPIICKRPGKRTTKLATHYYDGIFLRYAKTMKNIVYIDNKTKRIKTTTYAVFDEAHYSKQERPRGAKRLFQLGLKPISTDCTGTQTSSNIPIQINTAGLNKNRKPDNTCLQIMTQHPHAYVPTNGTSGSAGYDMHTIESGIIPAKQTRIFDTGISITPPSGSYGRIASRSGLVAKKHIEAKTGVIDPDYTGTIKIILHNFGNADYKVIKGDRIAQLILEKFEKPDIQCIDKLSTTERNDNSFGSTGFTSTVNTLDTQNAIAVDNIDFIFKSPEYTIDMDISTTDTHPLLGLTVEDSDKGIRFIKCEKGTSSARMPKWRTTLHGSYIRYINNQPIKTISELKQHIANCKTTKRKAILTFAPLEPISLHPDTGIPQLHFDQLNPLSHILHDMKHDEIEYKTVPEAPPLNNAAVYKTTTAPLTRKRLQQQDDWNDWIESERLQLDQYEQQDMFGPPGELPTGIDDINVLPMIWTYLTKTCGRKKARCVANGAPHLKGSVTLANTYAACLEQTAARIFWSLAATLGKLVFGSDASNAFGEAPAPKAPLFLRVDDAYRDWYEYKTGKRIPPSSYVRVKHAIQGHPESPRLWQEHIDKILRKLGFQPTTQEPCLYKYVGTDFEDKQIFLLRQVDDFAIACNNEAIANTIWDRIDGELSAPLKKEGLLARHNGIDIIQSQQCIKIHCETYLHKILSNKQFLTDIDITSNKPIPMKPDHDYITQFDTSRGPTDPMEHKALESKMGFKYRQATGELLFAMVTCGPDISVAVLKLTQHNNNPAEIHYKAAMDVYKYLAATKTKGLQFWRTQKLPGLPDVTPDMAEPEQYLLTTPATPTSGDTAYGYVDSDWGGNTQDRKSISGISVILGGAAVAYKTIHQKAVAGKKLS